METNNLTTSPKKKMTLQEEIESWQQEKWPAGFMVEQTKKNLNIVKLVFRRQFKILCINNNKSRNQIILNIKNKILEKHNRIRQTKGIDLWK